MLEVIAGGTTYGYEMARAIPAVTRGSCVLRRGRCTLPCTANVEILLFFIITLLQHQPPAAHLQPRHQASPRAARVGGRILQIRSSGWSRCSRCLDHRGRDRTTDGRLDRRAPRAQRLPPAPAHHLRPARHPARVRRGDHRFRPPRLSVREQEHYGVTPDMITFAKKGVTSGSVPMGGVIVRNGLYQAFMQVPTRGGAVPRLHLLGTPARLHGGLATLNLYREEGLFERAKALEPKFADAAMGLKGLPNVLNVRTVGITAAVDLARSRTPRAGAPMTRWNGRSTRTA